MQYHTGALIMVVRKLWYLESFEDAKKLRGTDIKVDCDPDKHDYRQYTIKINRITPTILELDVNSNKLWACYARVTRNTSTSDVFEIDHSGKDSQARDRNIRVSTRSLDGEFNSRDGRTYRFSAKLYSGKKALFTVQNKPDKNGKIKEEPVNFEIS